MIHSNDPWNPGPGHPVSKGAPVRTTEFRSDTEHKPETETDDERGHQKDPVEVPAPHQEHAAEVPAPHQEHALEVPVSQTKVPARPQPRQEKVSAFARVAGAARIVLPVVQKMLPLLEGNVASAAANLLTPTPRPVDLEPVKSAIGKLQAEQRTLRGQLSDQRESLISMEQELSTIREGLDRNAAQLRELAEDQLNLRRRLTRLMWMVFILLTLSIAFTTLVCIRLAYILRL